MAVRGDSMIHSMISAVLHVAAGSSAQRFPSSDALKKTFNYRSRLQVGIASGYLKSKFRGSHERQRSWAMCDTVTVWTA